MLASSKKQDDGLTYYYYELNAPAANGHSLTAVSAPAYSDDPAASGPPPSPHSSESQTPPLPALMGAPLHTCSDGCTLAHLL